MTATLRPTIRDWLLLVGSLAFTLAGVALVVFGEAGGPGVATVLFFGCCTVVAVTLIRQKLAAGDPRAGADLLARLQAGEALVPRRARRFYGAAAILGLGLALMATGGAIGPEFMAVSAAMAIGGAGLLVALLLGWQAGLSTRFIREGLEFSTPTVRYVVPWTAVVSADLAELHGNPIVRLRLGDVEAVVATVVPLRGDTAAQQAKLRRSFAASMRWVGFHLMFMPAAYGVDPVALFEALRRYLGDATLRAELPGANIAADAMTQ